MSITGREAAELRVLAVLVSVYGEGQAAVAERVMAAVELDGITWTADNPRGAVDLARRPAEGAREAQDTADRRKIGTYRDLDAFQIIEDRRVMVRLDQPGHRLAEEYVPASQLAGAVEALEKIKAEEGKVCDRFELCEHRACNSSYAAWAIADQALRAVREQ